MITKICQVGDTIQVKSIEQVWVQDDSNPDLVNGTFTIASVPTGSTLTYAVSGRLDYNGQLAI